MPYRIAIGSCSHPSLPQPLWPVLRSRRPSAFVWGGDAIYADRFAGMNWTAVGVSWIPHDDDKDGGEEEEVEEEEKATREKKGSWKVTFPPPSIHVDASPEIIREWYRRQWEVPSYREFVNGWERSHSEGKVVDRPVVFGTIDDHDYGSNNGDASFRFRRESNLEFLEFLYFGVPGSGSDEEKSYEESESRADSAGENSGVCTTAESEAGDDRDAMDRSCSPTNHHRDNHSRQSGHRRGRNKLDDPMYQRALEGKGVYGVQLFDFSRKFDNSPDGSSNDDGVLWGGGYWVPEEEALVDDDVVARVVARRDNGSSAVPNYSTTHSVAVFVLDVRSNKTPWPTKGSQHRANRPPAQSSAPIRPPPPQDFLGQHQWNWLRSSLRRSRAPLNVVLTGLQVHPHRFPNDGNIVEEWSKFPAAQELLYDVLLNSLDDDDDNDDDDEVKRDGKKENDPPKKRGSILLVSGDVHMAQFLRKDCVRARHVREALDSSHRRTDERTHQDESLPPSSPPPPMIRPLVEVTASGMTHSWGTSFSSQPKLHQWPRKPYTYFVSRTFMTLCHYVNPWREVMVRTAEDVEREEMERKRDRRRRGYDGGYDDEHDVGDTSAAVASMRGKMGLQYELGLNFAEFEFEFWDGREHNDNDGNDGGGNHRDSGGAVTVRIFGREGAPSPKLQSRWTFDQLSGDAPLPGMTAKFPEDFASVLSQKTYHERNDDEEWICIPHRGNASVVREYVANVIMFLVFCFLFFLPYLLMGYLFLLVRRRYRNKKR